MRINKAILAALFGLIAFGPFGNNTWAKIRNNPPTENELFIKGNALFNEGKYEEAIGEWSEVLKLNPSNQMAQESIRMAQEKIKSREPQNVSPPIKPQASEENTPKAEPKSESRKDTNRTARFFGAIEYFTVNGADQHWKDNLDSIVKAVKGIPSVNWAEGKLDSSPGWGGRAGVLFPIDNNFEIGGSLGYIDGPSADFSGQAFDYYYGLQSLSGTIKTNFIRLLAEGAKLFPISSRISLRLGAGLGIARGKVEETDHYSGYILSYYGFPPTVSNSTNWTGFTWEISPALCFDFNNTSLELGFRYAQFPKLEESKEWAEFNWHPFAVYGAVKF